MKKKRKLIKEKPSDDKKRMQSLGGCKGCDNLCGWEFKETGRTSLNRNYSARIICRKFNEFNGGKNLNGEKNLIKPIPITVTQENCPRRLRAERKLAAQLARQQGVAREQEEMTAVTPL